MQHTRKRAGLLKSALLGAATLGVVSLAGAGVAQAAPMIYIGLQQAGQNGGAIYTPPTGPGVLNPGTTTGASVTTYSFGTFTVNNITAAGDLLSGDNFGTTSINTTNNSSSASELTVWASEINITDPAANSAKLLSGFTLNNISGSFDHVVETTYFDSGNAQYGTATQLSTATFFTATAASAHDMSNAVALTGPYAITEEFQIYMTGHGTSNATITLQTVPEPGSLALLGTGLLGLGFVIRRRRRKA